MRLLELLFASDSYAILRCMDTSFISEASRRMGGQAALARAINVPAAMVWQWIDGRRPVPGKHCIPIERATGVSRHDLRGDIFGPKLPVFIPENERRVAS